MEFVENKGQWDKDILFRGEISNGAFFLQKQGFTVLLHRAEELRNLMDSHHGLVLPGQAADTGLGVKTGLRSAAKSQEILHSHQYQVRFLDANPDPEVVPEKPMPTYNNYYIGNDHSKWASQCRIFQAITYRNVYPNIDIRYFSSNGQLKYDILVHPGGDPAGSASNTRAWII